MTTVSDDIRRRLLAGEPLTADQTQSDYGCSSSLLGTIIAAYRKEGHTFAKERTVGNAMRYTLTHPKPEPSPWGPSPNVQAPRRGPAGTVREPMARERTDADRARDRERKRKQRHPSAGELSPLPPRPAKRSNGHAIEHPVPSLGESVSVFLLALDDDGSVRLGLRSGEDTWLTKIHGYAPRT